MPRVFVICAFLVALGGCSQAAEEASSPRDLIDQVEPQVESDEAPQNEFGFMEAIEQGPDPFGQSAPDARQIAAGTQTGGAGSATETPPPGPDVAQSDQQIAYTYGFGFQVAEESIATLQAAHVAMCEKLGQNCRVLRMSQANTGGWDGYGELELQVAADNAANFGSSLIDPAEDVGAELVSSVRDGEDLAEQIIDSEARLQSRLVLREKLTAILQTNRGSVDELVKAEKAVASVNEEIDATRSKLQKLSNRIRFSAVRIEYEPYFGESQLGFSRPVMTAIRSVGTTLGMTISAMIYALTALVPITLFILGLRWFLHRFGLRFRFWKNKPASDKVIGKTAA